MNGTRVLVLSAVLALAVWILVVLGRFATMPRDPMPIVDPIVFEVPLPRRP